jgi:hypothetical protein
VTVSGTSYGAQTRANGAYLILGVPPGTYTLSVRRVGFQTREITNVSIVADVVRSLDVEVTPAGQPGDVQTTSAEPVPQLTFLPAAGTRDVCPGPGIAFGVIEYHCASCIFKSAGITFQSEPIILEATTASALRAGDVITAINNEPITTQAGSDLFANPPAGPVTITARRNGARLRLNANVIPCERPGSTSLQFGVHLPRVAADSMRSDLPASPIGGMTVRHADRDRTTPVTRTDTLVQRAREQQRALERQIDSLIGERTLTPLIERGAGQGGPGRVARVGDASPEAPHVFNEHRIPSVRAGIEARYAEFGKPWGFGVKCETFQYTESEQASWTCNAPTITDVLPGTPAAAARLRPGDQLVQLNGHSLRTSEGLSAARQLGTSTPLRMQYMRDGRADAVFLSIKRTP